MMNWIRKRQRTFFCVLCAFLLAWTATAQETDESPPQISPPEDATELQAEMRAIFRRIETRLRDIDVLLTDAGAGDTRRLSEVGESGIDELLRRSMEEGREVQREIDELLRLAAQAGGGGGGGGSESSQGQGQGQSQGEGEQKSPLDGGPGEQRSQESTPSLPEGGQDGEQPGEQPGGEEPGGEKPGEGEKPGNGEKPGADGEAPAGDPENRASLDPQTGATDPLRQRADPADRWGELPVHARDVFRTEGSEDMPAEYRDWIDAYYKKLNERAARSR